MEEVTHGDTYKADFRSMTCDVSNIPWTSDETELHARWGLGKAWNPVNGKSSPAPKKRDLPNPLSVIHMVLSTDCTIKFSVPVKVSQKNSSAQNTSSVFSLLYLLKIDFCTSNSFKWDARYNYRLAKMQ